MEPSADKQKRRSLWLAALTVIIAAVLMAGCQAADSDSAGNGNSSAAADMGMGKESKEMGKSLSNLSVADQSSAIGEAASGGSEEGMVAAGSSVLGNVAGISGEEAFNGKIIYSASVRMRVEDVGATGTELRELIQSSGGYMLGFSDSRNNGDIGSVYTIKVPAQGFMPFVDRLEAMPNVEFQRDISGKDVSEEYVDLESRLKARRLVEDRLLGMMEKATKADDLLKFSSQLAEVQEQIEQITGRIRYLDANVAYSTIELRVYQLDQKIATAFDMDEKSLGTRLADTLTGSAEGVWKGVQYLLIFLVGALPVLAVLAIVAIPIYFIVKNRRKHINAPAKMPNEGNSPTES